MGERENLLGVFISMYMHLVRWRGEGKGAMFSQIMAEGTSSYGNGYEIFFVSESIHGSSSFGSDS